MRWARMWLLGNIGQQIEIEEIEDGVERLRARITNQQSTDRNQNDALVTLRREITDWQLVVGKLTRLLVAGGVATTYATPDP